MASAGERKYIIDLQSVRGERVEPLLIDYAVTANASLIRTAFANNCFGF
jgi:hypothetical protein